MAMDEANPNAGAPPVSEPRPVDVRDIEDALAQLWVTGQAGGHATMQAYVLNLIVFAGSSIDASEAQQVAATVGARHPSRTIILQTSDGAETRLRAWISAQCEFLGASDHAGSEQVMLEASGDGIRQLPGTVIPLLIPEVPVVLWWPGDELFTHPSFPAMMDASDELIVDSSAFADSLATLGRLHSLATEEYPGVALRDLVWARLTTWRELTAQFFDAPTTRPYLEGIHRVHITYAHPTPGQYHPEQALLYASWLASRLGWETIPNLRRFGRETMLVVRSGELPITLEFSAQTAPDLPPGCLLAMTIGAELGENSATFTIRRADDREHTVVTTDIHGQTTQERIVPMREAKVAEMLAEEVSAVRHDHVFNEALDVAVRLASSRSGGTR